MKPTRRDIVNVLRKRMIAELEQEHRDLDASRPGHFDPDPLVKAKAEKAFLAMPKVKKYVKALVAAGIPYKVSVVSEMRDETATSVRWRACIEVGFGVSRVDWQRTNMPASFKKKYEAHEAKRKEYQTKLQDWQRRYNEIYHFHSDNHLIAEVLAQMLLDGDEALKNLADALEERVKEKLAEKK